MKPKIITKSEFEQANNKQSYSNYVNYVNREETQNNFNNQFKHDIYIHYVFDESKTQSMFNNEKNFMNEEDINELKKSFKNAQDKNGIMWKEVISFDNDTLIKEGLYDSKTKILDEQKFRNSTRKMMEKFEDKEGLKNNFKWGASIHYNTDNIHIHVAGVENNVTRERGKIKQSTIDSMKSTFANDLFDISGERKAINEFIRDRIVKGLKENDELQFDKSFKKQTQKIHNKLKDIPLNQWNYNNNSLKHIRPDIDKLSEMYIQKYHSKEYEDFKDKLVQQSDIYKSTYGEKSNYKNYINTKIEDLYSRSGNTILKNIKQIHQNPNILNGNYSNKQTNKTNNFKQNIKSRLAFNSSLNNIKQGLKKDFETERNIREYDYEFGIEKEQQRE
ncbi:relaxase MobL (plasmid) [Staphylococcus haemolyticus]|uniref:MobP2 family relaxase n=1 Tax=Staphylococcus haemolyticus TaxID=1283 RepID=UPI001C43748F|nr:MobP2 family relaxase [Staphylococcus haemolyticus]MCG1090272.1 relaxase MobL [Staphylococcus epidermidis]QXN79072.1 relaxase MobL [Staphylococcus haemolyticus]